LSVSEETLPHVTPLSGVWIWLCSLGEDDGDGEEIGTENFLCGMGGEGGRKCELLILGWA